MNIFIRSDASKHIGTGHIMRCLVLAEDLRRKKATVTFICRKLPGNLIHFIKNKGFSVVLLPSLSQEETDPIDTLQWMQSNWEMDVIQTVHAITNQSEIDWLIVDHYAIGKKWEQAIKPLVKKLMVIDDLANRAHDCDVLLDQNLYKNPKKRYERLLPDTAVTLLGPSYLLLRQEFRDLKNIPRRNGSLKRILISFGGSDPTHETMKALKAIARIDQPEITVDVVVGYSNQHYLQIKDCCDQIPNVRLHCQIDYLAELMAEADLAIGAGGSTTWERCYVGLPAITIETAANQTEILSVLAESGAICHLGISQEVKDEDIANAIQTFISNPDVLKKMAEASALMMKDYKSCSVAEELLEEHSE